MSTSYASPKSIFSSLLLLTSLLGMRHEYPHPHLCPTTHWCCFTVCPSDHLHRPFLILALAYPTGHQDGIPGLCYCDGENLLMHRLPHPCGGLCHHLSQFLSLMQIKLLLGLLLTTEKRMAKPRPRMTHSFTLGASLATMSHMVVVVHECQGGHSLDRF